MRVDRHNRQLRVLLLGPLAPPFGGVEVMTHMLLRALEGATNVVVKHINNQVSRSLAEKGGKNQLRKSVRAVHQGILVFLSLLSFRPDVVYLPLTNSPSFLGFLRDCLFILPSLLLGKKVIIHLHGGYYFYVHERGMKSTFVKAILGKVSGAIVLGERLTSAFNEYIPESRIWVVPNGIDDGPFRKSCKPNRNHKKDDTPERVLFVGLMCPEKGFRDIIASVPLVPKAHFIFAGEWPSQNDRREVQAFLVQKGIENRVTFAGVISGPTKYDLFTSCDIFVFPTYFVYEGHPVSCIEALAAGLPIICTDHAGLSMCVQDGWNGYFVPPQDPGAIANRLNELIADQHLCQAMGKRSRRLFEEQFTLERFRDNWIRAIFGSVKGGDNSRMRP